MEFCTIGIAAGHRICESSRDLEYVSRRGSYHGGNMKSKRDDLNTTSWRSTSGWSTWIQTCLSLRALIEVYICMKYIVC